MNNIVLTRPLPTVLGMGAWFKNTVCLIHENQAWVTSTAGDLDQADACLALESNTRQLIDDLRQSSPQAILQALAHDLHPDFYSTRYGLQLAAEHRIPALPVQHHHAHIAAVCAEHGEDGAQGPILGLALDGVGLGTDGLAWGGELLWVNGCRFERIGHLQPLTLPGGDKAAREPWRMAASALFSAGRADEVLGRFPGQPAAAMVLQQLEKRLNCPLTSSLGRVFDAAAGLLGICPIMTFEAEAAILLEKIATTWIEEHGWPEVAEISTKTNEQKILDLLPLLLRLADWPAGQPVGLAAALFHTGLINALTQWIVHHSRQSGISKIALSGGCFFNHLLSKYLPVSLKNIGLTVLMPKQLLPGDTAISLGQAWVAALSVESSAV